MAAMVYVRTWVFFIQDDKRLTHQVSIPETYMCEMIPYPILFPQAWTKARHSQGLHKVLVLLFQNSYQFKTV